MKEAILAWLEVDDEKAIAAARRAGIEGKEYIAKHIGPNMPVDKQRLKKFREQVRDQVVKDATVHVRLTPELMARLIERAEAEQLPYGVLVRQWIEDGLNTDSIGKRLDRIERLLKRKA